METPSEALRLLREARGQGAGTQEEFQALDEAERMYTKQANQEVGTADNGCAHCEECWTSPTCCGREHEVY